MITVPELPSSGYPDFEWPTVDQLYDAQSVLASSRPKGVELCDSLWKDWKGAVRIPGECTDFQLRRCIDAHTGPSGHRGVKRMECLLKDFFFWSTLSLDAQRYAKACIHCLSAAGGERIPVLSVPSYRVPLLMTLFNSIASISVKIAIKGRYILTFLDILSHCKRFFSLLDTASENAASAIIE